MNTTTVKLQIPLDKALRDEVEKHARAQGFSSIQDFTRVMYSTLLRNNMQLSLENSDEDLLSPKAEARYARQLKQHERDRKAGKVKGFSDVNEALNYLHDL